MENRKSKVAQYYLRLLVLYVLVLLVLFVFYVVSVVFSSYSLSVERHELETQRMRQEAMMLFEDRLEGAEKIISRINYSYAFRESYIKLLSGQELSTSDRVTIIQELRSAFAWSGSLGIEEVVLFLDNSSVALSAAGVVNLSEPYKHTSFPTTYMEVSSISDILSVNSNRFTFSDSNLIVVHGFRYQGGNDRGVLCISFNIDKIKAKLSSIMDGGVFSVQFSQSPLFSSDDDYGVSEDRQVYTSSVNPKVVYEMDFVPHRWRPGITSILALLGGSLLFLVILILYLVLRRRYNRSLSQMRELIPNKESIEDDEIEAMISDLKGMLFEYNSYKDDLDHAAHYIEKGFFASESREEADNVYLNRYLGFMLPYYLVMAINFDPAEDEEINLALEAIDRNISSPETLIAHHRSDRQTVLMFFNMKSRKNESDCADKIWRSFKNMVSEDTKVTIGVDVIREDFSEFRKSCDSALKALNMMLVLGKDDIYYSEEKKDNEISYFMVPALAMQVIKCIRDGNGKRLEALFDMLLKTNLLKYDLNADSVKALSDELFITERKVFSALSSEVDYGDMRRPDPYATIEEVTEFYKTLFLDVMAKKGERIGEKDNVYRDIVEYVNSSFTDPDLSLKMLSDKFSVSSKSIGQCFSSRFGYTYLEYVTRKRISLSVTLLSNPEKSIEDVAKECGYSSTLTFRRNFKEVLGQTPSEFRTNDNFSSVK